MEFVQESSDISLRHVMIFSQTQSLSSDLKRTTAIYVGLPGENNLIWLLTAQWGLEPGDFDPDTSYD